MFKTILAVLAPALAALTVVSAASAQDRVTLGWGRLFNNDALGDGRDRWRTGSYTLSLVRGPSWSGALPTRPGEILEFRGRAETIAPGSLVSPAPDDRRYVGALSFGVHTHFQLAGLETSAGADLVLTGPQTGVGRFQRNIHDLLGLDEPEVLGEQIGNAANLALTAEVGRSFRFGERLTVRPFAEAQAGVETYVRVGGDVVLGGFGNGSLMLRDSVTGQRYRGVAGVPVQGTSLTFGADVAQVFDSVYLPGGEPADASETRARVRAGLQWQGDKTDVFYGVTWLGKEFESQPEGQLVGSLRVNIHF